VEPYKKAKLFERNNRASEATRVKTSLCKERTSFFIVVFQKPCYTVNKANFNFAEDTYISKKCAAKNLRGINRERSASDTRNGRIK
jgi:hypothetical protein